MQKKKKPSHKSNGAAATPRLDFPRLADAISRVDTALRGAAAASVNRMLTMRNWLIGMHIVEYEQKGEDRAQYGANLIPRLAQRLSYTRGFSERNLRMFREFYGEYPQISQLVTAELSSLKIEGIQIRQLPTAKLRDNVNNQAVIEILPSSEKLVQHFSLRPRPRQSLRPRPHARETCLGKDILYMAEENGLVPSTKIAVFKGREIRKTLHNNEWWFSVADVAGALTDSVDPGAYWRKLKERLKEEGSEVVTICHGLKLPALTLQCIEI